MTTPADFTIRVTDMSDEVTALNALVATPTTPQKNAIIKARRE